jgi:hypothetical protein
LQLVDFFFFLLKRRRFDLKKIDPMTRSKFETRALNRAESKNYGLAAESDPISLGLFAQRNLLTFF